MTVHEIFSNILNHQITGLMLHDQMADYYGFLGLTSYRKDHEKRYEDESKLYRNTMKYYVDHYHVLPNVGDVKNPGVIPQTWYGVNNMNIDGNTVRNSVKAALEKWVTWERDTKVFYQTMYKELFDLSEIAACHKVMEMIEDVDCELKDAEKYYMWKKQMDYDIFNIVESQK